MIGEKVKSKFFGLMRKVNLFLFCDLKEENVIFCVDLIYFFYGYVFGLINWFCKNIFRVMILFMFL